MISVHRRLSAVVLLFALSAVAKDKLSVQDIFNLELASAPQISADGKRIVYVRQFSDIMTDRRYSNLWIMNADGSDHRPLTSGNYSETAPRWSPDGTQLLYLSDRDGTPQVYRRWMDSGQTARVTNTTQAPATPSWSPDGKWIAFTMLVTQAPKSLVTMPAAPAGAKWAEPATVIDRLIYRFNGPGYLKPGYTHLFVVPAEGGTPRQISSGNFNHGSPAGLGGGGDPVWTPDGKFLLYSANRHDDWDLEPLNTEIYEFAVADGKVRALTSRKGPDGDPVISPDGKQIAYVGFDDKYQGYQVRKLYLMSRDGSGSRLVNGDWDRDVAALRWAPDGGAVYFLSDDHGNSGLYLATVAGQRRKVIGNLGASNSAYGGGGAFTVAVNGTIAFTYSRPNVPGDIAVTTATGAAPKILTAVNEDVLGDRQLGAVEELWYTSSKDGRKVHGWIIKPPGFDPAKKYPLILEIHGGPFANYGDRFDLEKQIMAASGYVVLYTNPRGSTSYGGEFGNLIHHAYPGDDFFDLNSGVDAMVAKGYVDPKRLYVTGGSGGGVLTCWMIGRSDRFRAAATIYPVINWYSFNLTADIGNMTTKYWFPGFPWDHVEHYEKRSLLSVVKNVKTPTMVMVGEEDYRTPVSESEQYYQALKLLKVETVLVKVPGEPHGITRRPSHHVAKILNMISWFDQHP